MNLRYETAADADAVAHVLTTAFGQTREAQLVAELRDAADYDPELAVLAVEEGRVVGYALLTPITIETATGPNSVLALAPVAVLPECQRQGIGTAVIREALERAKAKGHTAAIVLGHAEYYPRFGFVAASRFSIRAPFEVPDEAFMALEFEPGGLDGCAGTVRYPLAFGV